MIWHSLLLLFLISPFALFVQEASAQGYNHLLPSSEASDIIYQADVIQADLDKGSALLKGNVVIYFDGYKLTAPEAEIVKAESRFTARGGVKIENLMTVMTAEYVEIFMDNDTGILKEARIESGQMLIQAKEIRKLDKDVFEANNSYFTTCQSCPPFISFKAASIKTNIKKYVDLKWGRPQIFNQPFFVLPRLILPVNTRRKSGFTLIEPQFSTARGQIGLGIPYFWAIDDHKDVTITPEIFSKSGINTVINYRQVFDSRSKMEAEFGYMKDNDFVIYDFDTGTENSIVSNRWFLDFENELYLPHNFIQKSRVRLISDTIYMSDFPNRFNNRTEPNIENQISLIKNDGNNHFSSEIVYNINLLTERFETQNLDAVHRTPQIRYNRLNSIFLKNFRFSLDTEYNKFSRKGLSYDEVTVNAAPGVPLAPGELRKELTENLTGNYDPSAGLIRAGHRVFIQPKIVGSFNLSDRLILLPKLGLNQALYSFAPAYNEAIVANDNGLPFSELAQRGYFEGELELKSQFSKVFNKRWKHIVEPSVAYVKGSVYSETDHVFFQGTRDLPYYRRFQPINDSDFFDYNHGIQFDYYDRVENTEIVKISLLQTFLKKYKTANIDYYSQPIFFELSQNYDFINAQAANPDPWSTLNALVKIKTAKIETFTQASHFHKIKKTNFSTRNSYIYKPGKFVTFSYKNNYLINRNNQEEFHQEFVGLGTGWRLPFVSFSGEVLYSTLDNQVQQWQSILGYTPPGGCLELLVNVFGNIDRRQATNRPNFKFNVVWNFGEGSSKPSDVKTVF